MESVDCWPLVTIPIQTLGGKTSFGNHPSRCDCSLVSLTFTVYGTAGNHVSGVRVFTRGGPLVEGIRTRQLDAIGRDPNTLVAGGCLRSLPCMTGLTVCIGNSENFRPEAPRFAPHAADG